MKHFDKIQAILVLAKSDCQSSEPRQRLYRDCQCIEEMLTLLNDSRELEVSKEQIETRSPFSWLEIIFYCSETEKREFVFYLGLIPHLDYQEYAILGEKGKKYYLDKEVYHKLKKALYP